MSNQNIKSQGPSKVTGSPVDVHAATAKEAIKKEAMKVAVEKGKDLVKGVAEVVMKQQAPPGTPGLRK